MPKSNVRIMGHEHLVEQGFLERAARRVLKSYGMEEKQFIMDTASPSLEYNGIVINIDAIKHPDTLSYSRMPFSVSRDSMDSRDTKTFLELFSAAKKSKMPSQLKKIEDDVLRNLEGRRYSEMFIVSVLQDTIPYMAIVVAKSEVEQGNLTGLNISYTNKRHMFIKKFSETIAGGDALKGKLLKAFGESARKEASTHPNWEEDFDAKVEIGFSLDHIMFASTNPEEIEDSIYCLLGAPKFRGLAR